MIPTRRIVLVGLGATAVDVGVYLLLATIAGVEPWAADVAGLLAATPVSFLLHRLPSGGRPYQRWVEHPTHFLAVATLAGLVDVSIVAIFAAREGTLVTLLAVKVAALMIAALVRLAGNRRLLLRTVRDEQAVPDPTRASSPGTAPCAVVLPAYREASRIGRTVSDVRKAFGEDDVRIIVVDDGSPDETAAAATAAGADVVIELDQNRGKGAAVRAGMLAADAEVVVFTDADLAYSPDQLVRVRDEVRRGWDVVVGSRRHTDATALVRARRVRELGGRAINLLTQVVLLGRYVDTQCGLKAFRGDVATSVFSRTRVDGFGFDVEVFHIVERDRVSLLEVPVRVVNSERSTVRVVRDAAALVLDLFRIRRRAAQGVYESSAAPVAAPHERSG